MKYTRLPTLPVFTEPDTPEGNRISTACKIVAAAAFLSVGFVLGVVFHKAVGENNASAHCGDNGSINIFPNGTIPQGNSRPFGYSLILIYVSLSFLSCHAAHTPLP